MIRHLLVVIVLPQNWRHRTRVTILFVRVLLVLLVLRKTDVTPAILSRDFVAQLYRATKLQ